MRGSREKQSGNPLRDIAMKLIRSVESAPAISAITVQNQRLGVWCAAACAERALKFIPKGELRPKQAVAAAREWVQKAGPYPESLLFVTSYEKLEPEVSFEGLADDAPRIYLSATESAIKSADDAVEAANGFVSARNRSAYFAAKSAACAAAATADESDIWNEYYESGDAEMLRYALPSSMAATAAKSAVLAGVREQDLVRAIKKAIDSFSS